ncbi:MAG: cytochrome c [Steroidobacteraceae bacterium]
MSARVIQLLTFVGASLFCCASLLAANQEALPTDMYLGSALGKQPDETRGQKIFQLHCQQCHQAGAVGLPTQKIPALAGQQYEYLIKQVVDFLDQERANAVMHQQLLRSGLNNATSIADVVGYVANLPMNPAPEQGSGTELLQGKKIYEGFCASCHGRTAEGNGNLWVPNLRGQHYSYLVEQMQRMALAQRSNISDDLHRMFTSYADTEFQAVADYLSRWSPQ